MTTAKGNTFQASSPYDLQMVDAAALMKNFSDGTKPVVMGYLLTGKFNSSFPDGILVESDSTAEDANKPRPKHASRGLPKRHKIVP